MRAKEEANFVLMLAAALSLKGDDSFLAAFREEQPCEGCGKPIIPTERWDLACMECRGEFELLLYYEQKLLDGGE